MTLNLCTGRFFFCDFFSVAIALLITAVITFALIPFLRKKKLGQHIREDGPKGHLKKAGTPSMGGIAIVIAVLATMAITKNINAETLPVVLGFFAFGLIGFLDDSMKFLRGNNLGLRSWQKLVLQIAAGAVFAVWIFKSGLHGASIWIPFADTFVNIRGFAVPFFVFIMVAMTNGVNLTDGLDGLASSVTVIVSLMFAVLARISSHEMNVFFMAIAGACLGFLIFNKHPAKIFMGDTGSLALGGGLALGALALNAELLLPIVGIVYVIEVLSVIIQVVSFKTTGRRVFKMTPIHHHFEMMNLSEVRIVQLFCLVTLAAMLLSNIAV